MSPSLTVELRLPEDQLRALASLIAQSVGGSTGRSTYTVAEAAQKTRQSEKTIRRHIEAGRIVRVPHIHRTLIPAAALERYMHGDLRGA